jgi:hypothetical protein
MQPALLYGGSVHDGHEGDNDINRSSNINLHGGAFHSRQPVHHQNSVTHTDDWGRAWNQRHPPPQRLNSVDSALHTASTDYSGIPQYQQNNFTQEYRDVRSQGPFDGFADSQSRQFYQQSPGGQTSDAISWNHRTGNDIKMGNTQNFQTSHGTQYPQYESFDNAVSCASFQSYRS